MGYPFAQNFNSNRNNTYVIVHFCFCLVRLYSFVFFSERKFFTTKRSHYVSIIQPQAWCIFFLFQSDFFFSLSDFFFKRCNSLFYSVVIVYFRQTQLIILAYFGKINKFFKKIPFFSLFSSLFMSQTRKFRLLHFRNSKWITIIQNSYNYL